MDNESGNNNGERRCGTRYSFRHNIFLHFDNSFPVCNGMLCLMNISEEGLRIRVIRKSFPLEKLYVNQKIDGFINILGDNMYHVSLTVQNVDEEDHSFGCTWGENRELREIVAKLALNLPEKSTQDEPEESSIEVIDRHEMDTIISQYEMNRLLAGFKENS